MPASNRRATLEPEPKDRGEQPEVDGPEAGRVEAVNDSQEATSPQPAPAVRPELVSVMSVDNWRAARKATLVSPIPALLAASMTAPGDGTVRSFDDNGRMTSRVTDAQARPLEADADADYVVEVDPQDER